MHEHRADSPARRASAAPTGLGRTDRRPGRPRVLARLVIALCVAACMLASWLVTTDLPIASAFTVFLGETFTGASTPVGQWTSGGGSAPGSGFACLTAASTSAPGSIPACPSGPLDPV